MPLPVAQHGPLVKGVIDAANAALDVRGSLRMARNAFMDGIGRLQARPGTQVALTLKDDQGSPANVTRVVAIVPFASEALAVAHSDVTDKFYLYRLTQRLDGWYNAAGALQTNLTPQPVGVLWSSETAPDKVTIAEGLGLAFIAHADSDDLFTRPSKVFTPPGTIANLQADLDASGAVANTFFKGLVSFQQHLWGWGYGSEAGGQANRPELARFGYAIFGTDGLGGYFQASDSFGIGHRVRSYRDEIVAGVVAGDVLYFGTNYSLWPVTGFGRNSWDRGRALDNSYGFAGPQAAVAAGDTLYYWSHRGPMRVAGVNAPEYIGAPITEAIGRVVQVQNIILTFDPDRDQVLVLYQSTTSGRVSALAVFDVQRDIWLGPDGDIGLGVACAGLVEPVASPAPAGAPTSASTTGIGATKAHANWVNGDTAADVLTELEVRQQGTTPWTTVSSSIGSGATTYMISGLNQSTAYEWRVRHIRGGQASAWLGPVAGSQFTTASQLLPPTNLSATIVEDDPVKNTFLIKLSWLNSGEGSVQTEVYVKLNGPPNPPSGTLPLHQTVGVGGRNAYISIGTISADTRWCEIRHIRSGFTPSAFEPAGGPLEVTEVL